MLRLCCTVLTGGQKYEQKKEFRVLNITCVSEQTPKDRFTGKNLGFYQPAEDLNLGRLDRKHECYLCAVLSSHPQKKDFLGISNQTREVTLSVSLKRQRE